MPEEPTSPSEASQIPAFNPNDPASVAAAAAAILTFTRAPDCKTIFTDLHRLRVGNGVVNIIFCKTSHTPGPQILGNIIEEYVEIVMSWTQLKMLTQNLSSTLSAIEAEVSPIPVPQSFRINQDANLG